jgi:A/G-specific adenine glycosylase
MSILRSAQEPIATSAIESAWDDNDQVARALAGLLKDALIEQTALGDYRLRGSR